MGFGILMLGFGEAMNVATCWVGGYTVQMVSSGMKSL